MYSVATLNDLASTNVCQTITPSSNVYWLVQWTTLNASKIELLTIRSIIVCKVDVGKNQGPGP